MARRFNSLELAMKDIDARIRSGVQAAAQKAVDRQVKVLNTAVQTWGTKVSFQSDVKARTGLTTYRIKIVGSPKAVTIFGWVDKGTKPHRIPKAGNTGAKMLRFNTPYSARTAPIARANVGSGRAGGTVNFRKAVQHPGTKAREFLGFARLEIEEDVQVHIKQEISRL